ncbi:MAG TPA: protein-glutamate O-methyltransferase CheR [Candidatus Dormibacteraeota bacterium]|nr:protein-glutamate O-methyltransferase CheR [Candidatus Dormibacteraeota bacterium]
MSRSEAAALRLEGSDPELDDIETRLLLEGIRLRYGYDFREYALSPLRRALATAMARENVRTISAYQERLLHDAMCMRRFLGFVGVNVTTMFRDADMIRCLRQEVIPLLKTYPSCRIWIAGCASGEEVYSLAVLLREEGSLPRSTIFATDLNEDMLAVARLGTYPLERMRRFDESYQDSGGKGALSDHYSVIGRSARFHPDVQANITWARHNLVTDGSFNDFQLIVCANVMIYFRDSLQERVHRLFYDSLVRGGFLALGQRESLLHCSDRDHYEQVRDGVNLFRKLRW